MNICIFFVVLFSDFIEITRISSELVKRNVSEEIIRMVIDGLEVDIDQAVSTLLPTGILSNRDLYEVERLHVRTDVMITGFRQGSKSLVCII